MQGSEFAVRLPLFDAPDAATPAGDAPAEDSATLLAGRRILVVDDNRDAADSLCQLLAARGADTEAVYDGQSAIEAVARRAPHAVVLDIGMPGLDGYEVARQLRERPHFRKTLLIALTGWGQEDDRRRSRAAGFAGLRRAQYRRWRLVTSRDERRIWRFTAAAALRLRSWVGFS